ncbi:uncharacterized protein RCO7_02363 [Rhynchosporium graminicola]|uniref:Uncharacterized protein n=1 Tax=Rhynchosporium graminicola TaxID=2792576 RepID=A0A1E1JW24_9HELO|nr:uncharacterized protein RCO7_02363 [Rhynchosporium commune]
MASSTVISESDSSSGAMDDYRTRAEEFRGVAAGQHKFIQTRRSCLSAKPEISAKPAAAVPYTIVSKVAKVSSPAVKRATSPVVPYNPLEFDFTGEYFVENAGRLIPRAKDTAGNRLKDNDLVVERIADYDLIGKMRNLSLCQWHVLRSDCSNHRKEKCKRNHDTYRRPLPAREYDALWFFQEWDTARSWRNTATAMTNIASMGTMITSQFVTIQC